MGPRAATCLLKALDVLPTKSEEVDYYCLALKWGSYWRWEAWWHLDGTRDTGHECWLTRVGHAGVHIPSDLLSGQVLVTLCYLRAHTLPQ